jgi:elongation factor P
MIPVTSLRAGTTFLEHHQPHLVLKYEHTKMGRGTGNVKVKCRNLRSGATVEKTFITGAKVEPVTTQTKHLTYLYRDGDQLVFMDPRSFEQFLVPHSVVGEASKFLKESAPIQVLFWENQGQLEPLTVELPPKLTFTISQTAPGIKGDSASNVYKDATLENGVKIRVPLFISPGDSIRVDTRSGEYLERAK